MFRKIAIVVCCTLMATSLSAQVESRTHYGDTETTRRVSTPHAGVPQNNPYYGTSDYERPATPEQVEMVARLIKDTSFDDKRLKVAETCLCLKPMFAEDIKRIADCFSYERNKLQFLKMSIEHCCDVEKFYSMSRLLSFSSDRNEFLDCLDSYIARRKNGQPAGTHHQAPGINPQSSGDYQSSGGRR